MKVTSKKGFTLAELLIVMGIMVVLAAIAIPTFGKQLETAREAADAEAIRACLEDAFNTAFTEYVNTGTIDDETPYPTAGADITYTQKTTGFAYMSPSYTVGSGTVTVKQDTSHPASTDTKIFFYFDVDGDDGIKLDDIKVGTAAATAVSIKNS